MTAYPQKPKEATQVQGGLGIRAAWAFMEGYGADGPTNTRDIVGKATATKISTTFPLWAKSEIGPVLNFNGTDAITPDRVPSGNVFSIFALVKQTANAGNQVLYENSSIIWYMASGIPRWFDGADNAAGSVAIPLNVWVTMGFTSDGKNLTNWVNAVPVATAAKASTLPTGTVAMGGNTSGGQPFNGVIAGLYVATPACWSQGTVDQLQADFWFPLRRRYIPVPMPIIPAAASTVVQRRTSTGLGARVGKRQPRWAA